MPELKPRLLAVTLLLIILVPRASKISHLGTQSDEGVHLVVAARVARGEVLYGEIFENRTPLVELILAAAFMIFPEKVVIGRVMVFYATAISSAAIFAIGKLWLWSPKRQIQWTHRNRWIIPSIALIAFGFTPLAIFWTRFTMLEHWQLAASTMTILAILVALRTNRNIYWFFVGIMAGTAVLAKQAAISVVVASIIIMLMVCVRKGKNCIPILGYWLIGILLPLALFLTLLVITGTLSDFALLLSSTDQLAPLENIGEKLNIWLTWSSRQPLILLAILGTTIVFIQRRWFILIIPIWAMLEILVLMAPQRLDLGWGGFSHYAIPATAALALLASVGVQFLVKNQINPFVQIATELILLISILIIPAWWSDINHVLRYSNYPMPDMEAERQIGQELSSLAHNADGILVLANSVFYLHAEQLPINRFFHYPEYLPTSAIKSEAEADIVAALINPQLGAVAVSRLHWDERLTGEVKEILYQYWVLSDIMPYPYQKDILLYSPRATMVQRQLEREK